MRILVRVHDDTLDLEDRGLIFVGRDEIHSGLQRSGKYYFIRGTESGSLQLDPPRQGQHQPAQNLNLSLLSE
jgi:hypothetical protein